MSSDNEDMYLDDVSSLTDEQLDDLDSRLKTAPHTREIAIKLDRVQEEIQIRRLVDQTKKQKEEFRKQEEELRKQKEEYRKQEEEFRKQEEELRKLREQIAALTMNESDSEEIIAAKPVNDSEFKRGPLIKKLCHYFEIAKNYPGTDLGNRAANLSAFDVVHFDMLKNDVLPKLGLECPFYRLPLNNDVQVTADINTLSMPEFLESPLANSFFKWIASQETPKHSSQNGLDTKIWTRVMETLLEFKPSVSSLPEDQYRTSLWTPLLNQFIVARVCSTLYGTVEFRMRTLKAYKNDARTDIVYLLHRLLKTTEPLPICLVECCAASLGKDSVHKDFSKLVTEMLAALLTILGACRMAGDAELEKICMFGALTSGPQIRFCVLSPVVEDGAFSFVFQAPDEWFVDLSTEYVEPSTSCYISASQLERDCLPSEEIDDAISSTAKRGAAPAILELETSDRFENWPDTTNIAKMNPQNADFTKIMPGLKKIFNFGKLVASKAVELDELISRLGVENLKDPYEIPPHMRKFLPGSCSSSSSASPRKDFNNKDLRSSSKQQQKYETAPENVRGALVDYLDENRMKVETIEQMSKRALVAICKDWNTDNPASAVVIKKVSSRSNELKFLRKMQRCQNVVRLLDYRLVLDRKYMLLNMEYLTHEFQFGETLHELCRQVLWACKDGFNALFALKQLGIIHRDISSGNFLYSPRDDKWKLLDFGYAVKANNEGRFDDDRIVGTKDFIAPEVQQSCEYSFETDAFAMANVLRFCVVEPGNHFSVFFSEDASWKVLGKARHVVCSMSLPEVASRQSLEVATQNIDAAIEYLDDFMERHYRREE